MTKTIWVIEDERDAAVELRRLLEHDGYEVRFPRNFTSWVEEIAETGGDLILLDLNLPFKSGFQGCLEIRRESNIPILILTSRDTTEDELLALELGADDYLTKPFRPTILLARVQALLRRSNPDNPKLELDYLRLYPLESTIERPEVPGDKRVLSRNTFCILAALVRNEGRVVARDALRKALWQIDAFVDDNTLSVNVNRLRGELEEWGLDKAIVTLRGQGYRMMTSAEWAQRDA